MCWQLGQEEDSPRLTWKSFCAANINMLRIIILATDVMSVMQEPISNSVFKYPKVLPSQVLTWILEAYSPLYEGVGAAEVKLLCSWNFLPAPQTVKKPQTSWYKEV